MNDIAKIAFAPHNSLRCTSIDVEPNEFGEELNLIVKTMFATMYAHGGLGLSANQIGLGKRIFVADLSADDSRKPICMINPVITFASEELSRESEGCLSLPMFLGDIERPRVVRVKYLSQDEVESEEEFLGLKSHIVQHEIDHLNGVTLLDKVSRLKRNMYTKKIKKIRKKFNL